MTTAAVITIKAPGTMTPKGRKDIAAWLRHHAEMLLEHGEEYTHGIFRGRYAYGEPPAGAQPFKPKRKKAKAA